jgi:hypothetical protein
MFLHLKRLERPSRCPGVFVFSAENKNAWTTGGNKQKSGDYIIYNRAKIVKLTNIYTLSNKTIFFK